MLPARTIRRALVLVLACAALLLGVPNAGAATIHVDAASTAPAAGCGDVAAACPTLAAAAAVAAAGDVVRLAEGSYAGASFTSPVTVRIASDDRARPISVEVTGSSFPGGTIAIGAGTSRVVIAGNRFTGSGRTALMIDDNVGRGATGGIEISGNSIAGYGSALQVTGDQATGTITMRGNRSVGLTGTWVLNVSSAANVDARANWWGSSAGVPVAHVIGADVSRPLRLELTTSEAVLPGGSALVTARLVDPGTGTAEPAASGAVVDLAASGGSLTASSITLRGGTASTLLTAGDALGELQLTATLDAERASATTRVVAGATPTTDAPGEAAGPAAIAVPRFGYRLRIVSRRLVLALRTGIHQVVSTNRRASVRTTLAIGWWDARNLGLRPRTSHSREDFVIGSSRTRAIRGTRFIRTRLTPRARWAIGRADRRIAVIAHVHVRTSTGVTRQTWRRVVLPANVR